MIGISMTVMTVVGEGKISQEEGSKQPQERAGSHQDSDGGW